MNLIEARICAAESFRQSFGQRGTVTPCHLHTNLWTVTHLRTTIGVMGDLNPDGQAQNSGNCPSESTGALVERMYSELRTIAEVRLSQLGPSRTWQPTALVHEAFLRLVKRGDPDWNSPGHFFASAAVAMRNILVERARRKAPRRQKPIAEEALQRAFEDGESLADDELMMHLDDALRKLGELDARKEQVVVLKFFGGLSIPQIAQLLKVAMSTVELDWTYSKAWLHREIRAGR